MDAYTVAIPRDQPIVSKSTPRRECATPCLCARESKHAKHRTRRRICQLDLLLLPLDVRRQIFHFGQSRPEVYKRLIAKHVVLNDLFQQPHKTVAFSPILQRPVAPHAQLRRHLCTNPGSAIRLCLSTWQFLLPRFLGTIFSLPQRRTNVDCQILEIFHANLQLQILLIETH